MATAVNLGSGGAVLNAVYGSAPGANVNAPLLLDHDGTNYAYLPGLAGNYLGVTDSADLDITGDIDVRVLVMLDDWDTGAEQTLSAKFTNLSANRSWQFRIGTTGALQLVTSADGTAILTHTSSVVPTLFSGVAYWLRATIDVASGSDRVVQFFQAPFSTTTPTVWAQIGTTITTAGTTSIFDSAAPLTLGCINAGLSVFGAGKFYRAQVLSGILGTVACDINCMTGITSGSQVTFTESSTNAATVTINRSTSGRKAVAVVRDVWLLGLDDWFEVADNALLDFTVSESFTVMAVVRQWATPLLSGRYVSKGGGGVANTWVLTSSGTTQAAEFRADGTTGAVSAYSPASTSGTLRSFSAVHDGSAAVATAYLNGTAGTPVANGSTGTYANTSAMIVGASPGGLVPQEFECLGVAIWRRALTQAEIAAIASYYGT